MVRFEAISNGSEGIESEWFILKLLAMVLRT